MDNANKSAVLRGASGKCKGRFGPLWTVVGLMRSVAEIASGAYNLFSIVRMISALDAAVLELTPAADRPLFSISRLR